MFFSYASWLLTVIWSLILISLYRTSLELSEENAGAGVFGIKILRSSETFFSTGLRWRRLAKCVKELAAVFFTVLCFQSTSFLCERANFDS